MLCPYKTIPCLAHQLLHIFFWLLRLGLHELNNSLAMELHIDLCSLHILMDR
ncbi:hypothetical protein HanXRQr2_Chr10g0421621 [Helianthus annuus]|uniref:Uncharacterized protein n=1 Tax=Helianthus annuus TaxID=4232 RepID=A0A9K3HUG6_HELAN|nr:hypothetical protein HanXRQr2_Chr10g0421621 [Helianthus annuus]KAJ0882232.1 hypothetical protein HanPSC8_Chr10g0407281 [Helianthus annuus]